MFDKQVGIKTGSTIICTIFEH